MGIEKKRKILIILIIVVVIIVISGLVLYLVHKNTGFLTFNVSEDDIQQNNQNIEIGNNNNDGYTTLQEQELIVPGKYKDENFTTSHVLNIPEGFTISVYASGLGDPRFMTITDEGTIISGTRSAGNIYLLPDNDKDSIADNIIKIDTDLQVPHSVYYHKGDLYVAEEHQVSVYRDLQEDGYYSSHEVLVTNLPTGGHNTRTVVIGPDNKMYLSIGSSCNVCEEKDSRRAAIVRYDIDGTNEELYAEGLRNTVGFTFRYNQASKNFNIWSADMGRDLIGDDIPPEEVNIIEQKNNYGWPFCYGNGIANPEYEDRSSFCENNTVGPLYTMQAHSAPLGIAFIPNGQTYQEADIKKYQYTFPESMTENVFIAFHGSWNRTTPTGYKVVRIDTSSEDNVIINFITGWLEEDGSAWGRPVGIVFGHDGSMYISDDKTGAIYKVVYNE